MISHTTAKNNRDKVLYNCVMSNLSFQDQNEFHMSNRASGTKSMPLLVRLLVKTGLKRNEAYMVLLVTFLVCTIATYFILRGSVFSTSFEEPTYLEDLPPEIQKTLPPEVLNQIPSRKKN